MAKADPFVDFYILLDIPPTATAKEIRKAYRARVQEAHPDRNNGDITANERTVTLNLARDTLLDPKLRHRHDHDRHRARARRARRIAQAAKLASKPTPPTNLPVRHQPVSAPAPPAPESAWSSGLLLSLGLGLGTLLLLSRTNSYDGHIGRYRDRRGRFRKTRFS